MQGKIINVRVKKKTMHDQALGNPMFNNPQLEQKFYVFEDFSSTRCFLLYKHDLNQSKISRCVP
jgi:hypothetical protein